jgi:beta-lactamase class A
VLLTRRALLTASTTAVFLPACASRFSPSGTAPVAQRLAKIRARIGGRVGVHALDTESGGRIGFDDQSRYAMASTFKLLLAAAILSRIDRGALSLGQAVPFDQGDMVPYAPITSANLARGSMTVQELCAAVVEVSDNPAANLLLKLIGGPAGYTEFARRLGDRVTRLDRIETELNTNLPGDLRDTTTPRAMVDSMQQVLTGPALSASSRALLIDWLIKSRTGLKRIRAGLPATWKAGDKTGTGENGALNDLAIAWAPQRKPVLIAIYLSESSAPSENLNAAHAEIAGLIARELVA